MVDGVLVGPVVIGPGEDDVNLAWTPDEDEAAEAITFRCPIPEVKWLEPLHRPKGAPRSDKRPTRSKVVAWAVRLGRAYIATVRGSTEDMDNEGDLTGRIDALCEQLGVSRVQAMRRALIAGIAVMEKGSRGR